MFEIRTENYIAKIIVFNALNVYIKTKEAVALYRKACKQSKTGKIVLDTIDEIKLWNKVLYTYRCKPSEQKVYDAMSKHAAAVVFDIEDAECLKWEMYAD